MIEDTVIPKNCILEDAVLPKNCISQNTLYYLLSYQGVQTIFLVSKNLSWEFSSLLLTSLLHSFSISYFPHPSSLGFDRSLDKFFDYVLVCRAR